MIKHKCCLLVETSKGTMCNALTQQDFIKYNNEHICGGMNCAFYKERLSDVRIGNVLLNSKREVVRRG